MSEWEIVIGLEVHAQLATASKIFSPCPHGAADGPNRNVDPVSLGLPGTLPVLNREAVRGAVMMGLATGSTIARTCRFARKHYFYPDLPKGYQISQFDEPICEHGFVNIPLEGGGEKRIGITRIHMEDDAGKTVHDSGRGVSRVDYNRAGVPLIEIVSEPELSHPDEVVAYLKALHRLVRFLGISDGNMEAGNFRADANISLRPVGSEVLGTKAELKNMNSFRNVHRALLHEVERQRRILEDRLDDHLRLFERLLERLRHANAAHKLLHVLLEQVAVGDVVPKRRAQRLERAVTRVLGVVVQHHAAAAPHELASNGAAHAAAADDADAHLVRLVHACAHAAQARGAAPLWSTREPGGQGK